MACIMRTAESLISLALRPAKSTAFQSHCFSSIRCCCTDFFSVVLPRVIACNTNTAESLNSSNLMAAKWTLSQSHVLNASRCAFADRANNHSIEQLTLGCIGCVDTVLGHAPNIPLGTTLISCLLSDRSLGSTSSTGLSPSSLGSTGTMITPGFVSSTPANVP